jgi:cellulose synthase/poly-beta-1,6-N-acetylglucosamine synthase-like glycosyltransferase
MLHTGWILLFCSIMGAYLLLIAVFCISWIKMRRPDISALPAINVSVVIPVRNEALSLRNCLNSMAQQNYPKDLFEIILVDDDSTDGTAEITEHFIQTNPQITCRLIRLSDQKSVKAHKKRALSAGIQQSRGELILTTDGDCMAGPEWVRSMALFYQNNDPALIIGPVAFHHDNWLLGKMQSLEYAGLMMVGGASAGLNIPLLCSGANLGYPRKVFDSVKGYSGDDEPSGDDVMLMHKIAENDPGRIRFLKCREAIVWTAPQDSISAFLEQRRRWSSKFKRYKLSGTAVIAVLVFLCNALILIGPLVCLFDPGFAGLYLILAGGKLIIDFLFLFLGISFLHRKALIWVYLPEQLVYSVYVVMSGCLAFKKGYSWKGRRV